MSSTPPPVSDLKAMERPRLLKAMERPRLLLAAVPLSPGKLMSALLVLEPVRSPQQLLLSHLSLLADPHQAPLQMVLLQWLVSGLKSELIVEQKLVVPLDVELDQVLPSL